MKWTAALALLPFAKETSAGRGTRRAVPGKGGAVLAVVVPGETGAAGLTLPLVPREAEEAVARSAARRCVAG